MILLSAIDPSKQEFDDAVNEVLKRPEYKQLTNVIANQIEHIKTFLKEMFIKFLQKIFSNIEIPTSTSGNFSMVFMFIGILAVFALVIFITIKIYKSFERKTKIKEILGEKIDDKTTPNSLREKADNFQKAEDFRQAIRFDFIALLLLMHEKNVIYLDETKTNEEIYKYLKKNNFSCLDNLTVMIDIFNSSWYGHKVCDKEVYEEWKKELDQIWSEVINYEDKNK